MHARGRLASQADTFRTMENRHKDALRRIAQADAMWSKDGHEPVVFHLIPRGGMQRQVDHPRWDESWSIPGEATIDDLQEMGFLRVEPVGLNQNGRTFSLTLKGREAAAALTAPIVVSSDDALGPGTVPQSPEGVDPQSREGEIDAASPPRTAFISWAHGDQTWERTIARFASQLRAFGVNADVDLFHLNDDDVIWANYGGQAIQVNEFVLIAVNGPYKERWEGTNDRRVGAGAAREANVMKGLFDDDQHDFFRKVKIVLLPGSTVADIPAELRAAAQRFEIHTLDLDGLEELLRTLTGASSLRAAASRQRADPPAPVHAGDWPGWPLDRRCQRSVGGTSTHIGGCTRQR